MPPAPLAPVDRSRWEKAQAYEADWWRQHGSAFRPDYLHTLADEVTAALAPVVAFGPGVRVLEIGAGPVGIVAYLDAAEAVATDPLDATFATEPAYASIRTEAEGRGVTYVAAQGEALPFGDATFDAVLTDNVLDHVEAPGRILREMHRVLRPGGGAYVRVHVYHRWGRAVRWSMERLEIDRGHPHTLSAAALRRAATEAGFAVSRAERSSFFARWRADAASGVRGNRKALAQAALGVTRADYTLVLRKP